MFKTVALFTLSTISFLSAPSAMASNHYLPASMCFNTLSNGTDGVDRFDAKMAKQRAKKTGEDLSACIAAKVYLNAENNGTDSVSRFDARMRASRAKNKLAVQHADVYLNSGSNGSDGVDRFDEKMRPSRAGRRDF